MAGSMATVIRRHDQGKAAGAICALRQPEQLPADESFRALAEFDAERASRHG